MALVYSQEIVPPTQGNNIMNYSSQRELHQSSIVTNDHCTSTAVAAIGLPSHHRSYQQSSLSTNEYLQPASSISHIDTCNTTDNLMNYSTPVCPLYRPSMTADQALNGGASTNSLSLHTSPASQQPDDVCFMIDPSTDLSANLHTNNSAVSSSNGMMSCPPQGLNWQAFMVDKWYCMRDRAMQDITHDEITNGFIVEADKGFNYSQWDESFVCQKKNHFQISIQLKLPKLAKYLKKSISDHEMEVITCFGLHLHGMKFEAAESIVMIEQSKTDRSKLAYEPLLIDLPNFPDQLVKVSACRLHFSETTANNMRKRGKPNPDQRYFSLVVSLHAYTTNGNNYPVVAYVSERIIVRASNPGQFDNEGDSTWLKGINSNGNDVVFYQGKVGINTETPEEALTVVGNVQVTGSILQPSDARLKTDITEMDTEQMLRNMEELTLYSYFFKENAFGDCQMLTKDGGDNIILSKEEDIDKEVGLLAQDVEIIIPSAVRSVNINGKEILVLNKDRIMMECIGAIQELGKRYDHTKNTTKPKTCYLFVLLIILFVSVLCIAIVIVTSVLL